MNLVDKILDRLGYVPRRDHLPKRELAALRREFEALQVTHEHLLAINHIEYHEHLKPFLDRSLKLGPSRIGGVGLSLRLDEEDVAAILGFPTGLRTLFANAIGHNIVARIHLGCRRLPSPTLKSPPRRSSARQTSLPPGDPSAGGSGRAA